MPDLHVETGNMITWVDGVNEIPWDVETDVLVIGGGGCGMVASLAAAEVGARVLLVEKESRVGGNTSLSQGMIPAAGSILQKKAGVDDSPEQMAKDILEKNQFQSDPALTLRIAQESASLVDWLVDKLNVQLTLVTNFLYPGHTKHRVHAPSTKKGVQLVNRFLELIKSNPNIDIAYRAPAVGLVATRSNGAVVGATVDIRGVGLNRARAARTILALNGFGANREMLARYIPDMADAYYFGHEGNTGEGIRWGEALGAALLHMDAYQAHGSVAYPEGTLLTWASISLGGYQINLHGLRFVNESHGYSEHALHVLAQPKGIAFAVFDQRIFDEIRDFEDFQQCLAMSAVKKFDSIEDAADKFGINRENFLATHEAFQKAAAGELPDPLGRPSTGTPLKPPFYVVRVTGALFHTQGGLKINERAEVVRMDGSTIPNLYAGGGTAVGLSGRGAAGYLSCNGLLAALVLGKIAGQCAGIAAITSQ
uniref:FAD-dependent oxidoreductase n=1 Tax=Desulfomonile tiedjei TaxID=2358 RepID=A0A7C4AQZ5_9BACT